MTGVPLSWNDQMVVRGFDVGRLRECRPERDHLASPAADEHISRREPIQEAAASGVEPDDMEERDGPGATTVSCVGLADLPVRQLELIRLDPELGSPGAP
jgi:hypothetical protein